MPEEVREFRELDRFNFESVCLLSQVNVILTFEKNKKLSNWMIR